MKKIALMVAVGALGTLASACGSPARTDAGVDTNPIILNDSGPRDAFRRADANTAPAMCSAWAGADETGVATLPASCLPRCSAATLTTVNACPQTGSCTQDALTADITPAASMMGPGGEIELDCGLCYYLNQIACFSEPCPAEAFAFLGCQRAADADMCMGELTAFNTCLMAQTPAQQMTTRACLMANVSACFGSGGGFVPTEAQLRDVSQIVSNVQALR